MALAILDLDDFKRINDSSGHAAGDQVLRQAATTIASYIRRSDRAFRVGGDEFALILPDTDADQAQIMVRRLLAACLDGESGRGFEHTVSFSAGHQRRARARRATASRSTARPTPRSSGASATVGRA